jgi:branched-chain amino acid transport system substrate-binding protein
MIQGGSQMKRQGRGRREKTTGLSIVLFTTLLVLTGFCSHGLAQKTGEIKIGIIEPLSGPLALIGEKNLKGYQLAIDKINVKGGIQSLGGAKLTAIIGDSEGKPQVAMSQAERLINQGAVLLVGAYQSAAVFSATQTAERFKTPFIVSLGIADNITERGLKYTFRVMGTSSMLSKQFMGFLKEIGKLTGKPVKRIGLLYEDTLFGKSMSDTHKKYVGDFGYEIVSDVTYPSGKSELSGQVSKLVNGKPDFIILTSYLSDAIVITRTLYELNVTPLGFLGTGGYDQPDYVKETGKLSENFLVSAMWSHTVNLPGVTEVNGEFKKLHGFDMTGFAAICYTSAYLIKDVLERAASVDKEKLRKALEDTDMKVKEKGNILHYGIKFDEKGQNIHATELTEQVQGGQFAPVWPPELAPSKPIWPFPGWKK